MPCIVMEIVVVVICKYIANYFKRNNFEVGAKTFIYNKNKSGPRMVP